MDITTFIGIGSLLAIVWLGATSGELPATFLNTHGLMIVLGGTFAAMMINTPLAQIGACFKALWIMVRGHRHQDGRKIVESVTSLAEDFRVRGIIALDGADSHAAGGFLAHAANVALEHSDPAIVEDVLENEINRTFDRQIENVNVFRTMGVLSPMFGLLGTLIGIVSVLKHITNPEEVGAAMAISVTTAFYGIILANAFCVPVAGKLRLRYIQEMRSKSIAAEGIVMMLKGAVPMAIERKLSTHL